MSASTPPQPSASGDDFRFIYWFVGGVLLILVVIGLITYSGQKDDAAAQAKAQELTQKFERAGLPVPADQDIIVKSLGTDGGAVCDNPANALGRALFNSQLTNGAAFVGQRPVIADRRVLVGQALILDTYCPEELQEFRDKLGDYKVDDTIEQ
ncbi:hypothetical protein VSS74_13955 [Conexibacter stalactiti]|uniref:DUF732 domain-containing protein n=1 Tax=Conexibacter stalactiti TaxID=1940611 RepID=A0ABU4HQE1_9ACTN|nr:hypothetical protein [Conexibacter stalactiti]MDW5595449.1 hypothetical protein [Conexibacter stalactiti]MEC5036091.1 hypothetical protein [Conexibacter stalactiti]